MRADGVGAEALRRGAEALAVARHPGVAELLDLADGPAGPELTLGVPEGEPVASLALTLEEVAGVVATVATTVADLHDIGVTVGTVDVAGVRVTPEGHAVLTDFTHAGRLAGGPAEWPQHPLVRADDRELGRLLGHLLDASSPGAITDLLDGPRFWARLRGHRVAPAARVRQLAERASSGAVHSRRLAELLATDVPGACLPDRARSSGGRHRAPDGDGGAPADGPGHPALRDALEAPPRDTLPSAVAPPGWTPPEPAPDDGPANAAMERWFDHDDAPPGDVVEAHGRRRRTRRWPAVCAGGAAIVALLTVGRASASAPPARCAASPGTGSATGCAVYRNGVLSVNGVRYAVGTPTDVAAIGRWSCGAPSLALLRPATGQVWVYEAFPSGSHPVTPTLGAIVEGARRLAVVGRARCDVLTVVRADGAREPLWLNGAP